MAGTPKGMWINLDTFHFRETGNRVGFPPFRRILYYVSVNDCRFLDPLGRVWGTRDKTGLSDGGTIPWPFTVIVGRSEYMPAYWFHDQLVEHRGLYLITDTDAVWKEIPRKEADVMLRWMVEAMPNCQRGNPWVIYTGARLGTMVGFRSHTEDK